MHRRIGAKQNHVLAWVLIAADEFDVSIGKVEIGDNLLEVRLPSIVWMRSPTLSGLPFSEQKRFGLLGHYGAVLNHIGITG